MSEPPWLAHRLAARLPQLRRRARLVADSRGWFAARGYVEVETPCLVPCPGMEPHLDVFETWYEPKLGQGRERLFLRTSPEFAIKKLLAGGVGRCFELARVFRNGEVSARHSPEFTMLEFYAPGMTLDGLMDETEAYCAAMLGWTARAARLSVAEAFARHAGVPDLLAVAGDGASLAAAAGVVARERETWQDLFFRLMGERVEPALARLGAPVFLFHWPASEAALARRAPADARVAERVELYAGGVELANGFVELTDASEQRARFEAWRDERAASGGSDHGWDEDFLRALESMPQSAGIAIGFDRVVMLASGAATIEEVLWMPVVPVGQRTMR
ncbi:MAG: EF-P lysine aminoacylase GenX [Acetobacteraceae bacterium]|nr:EF-P lysine aminoacylase GenX [Acetobacteraceae bacterium]